MMPTLFSPDVLRAVVQLKGQTDCWQLVGKSPPLGNDQQVLHPECHSGRRLMQLCWNGQNNGASMQPSGGFS